MFQNLSWLRTRINWNKTSRTATRWVNCKSPEEHRTACVGYLEGYKEHCFGLFTDSGGHGGTPTKGALQPDPEPDYFLSVFLTPQIHHSEMKFRLVICDDRQTGKVQSDGWKVLYNRKYFKLNTIYCEVQLVWHGDQKQKKIKCYASFSKFKTKCIKILYK